MTTISTPLEEDIVKKIDKMAHEMNLKRVDLIQKYILDGCQRDAIKRNIKLIHQGEISIGQAAQNAGTSIYRIIEVARQMEATIGGDQTTVAYEIEGIRKRIKSSK